MWRTGVASGSLRRLRQEITPPYFKACTKFCEFESRHKVSRVIWTTSIVQSLRWNTEPVKIWIAKEKLHSVKLGSFCLFLQLLHHYFLPTQWRTPRSTPAECSLHVAASSITLPIGVDFLYDATSFQNSFLANDRYFRLNLPIHVDV